MEMPSVAGSMKLIREGYPFWYTVRVPRSTIPGLPYLDRLAAFIQVNGFDAPVFRVMEKPSYYIMLVRFASADEMKRFGKLWNHDAELEPYAVFAGRFPVVEKTLHPSSEISVVICTRNRAASLAECLRALTEAARTVSAAIELVVVDNGSTDDTTDVVAAFVRTASFPVSRVEEKHPGLARARNVGIGHARG